MTRGARFLAGAVLLLAGCSAGSGTSRADLEDALAVELPGFRSVAGPGITAVCDPVPGGDEVPELPKDVGEPVSVVFARAEATVEAHAWAAEDEAAARSVVDDIAGAADACEHEMFSDADTDGDGRLDAGGTDVQTVEAWEGSGWTGVLVHREVSGPGAGELVERRLVRSGDVVLLAVFRSDRVDDETEPLDTLLDQVHRRLG